MRLSACLCPGCYHNIEKNSSHFFVLFPSPRITEKADGMGEEGSVFPVAISMIFSGHTGLWHLCLFLAAIVFFHGSEYILAIAIHGRQHVSFRSLLISKQYVLAMSLSVVEYIFEIILFPGLKEHWWISYIGVVLVVVGEIIRKAAVLTARRAFTHNIKVYREEHHELVTHGIYRFVRHPGYCGFFIWAPATQIMLCNPICTIAFTLVTWRFFSTRIPYEEYFLIQFFGSQYEEYSSRVPSGVPFVR